MSRWTAVGWTLVAAESAAGIYFLWATRNNDGFPWAAIALFFAVIGTETAFDALRRRCAR